MAKVKVGVAGYGTIGTRLADGVVLQEDMELVGIVGHSPSLASPSSMPSAFRWRAALRSFAPRWM